MDKQSAEEAVAAVRGAAIRAHEAYLKGAGPAALLMLMGEHLDLEEALIARLEAAEARAERAEAWVLEHSTIPYQGQYVTSGQWMTFSLCVACGRPVEDHAPDCYAAELEARRA